RAATLLDGIPFIDDDDNAAERFLNEATNMQVLFGDSGRRVEHEQDDVGAFHRLERAEHAELLHPRLDFAALAHAGGVDQRDALAMILDVNVDGVTGRPGDRTDDDAVFPEQAVKQAALADVRSPNDGDLHVIIFIFFSFERRN